MNRRFNFLLLILAVLLPINAFAHSSDESYVFISIGDQQLQGRFEVPLDDLGKVLEMDTNNDGQVTVDEYEALKTEAEQFMEKTLVFRDQSRTYQVQSVPALDEVRYTHEGRFAMIDFVVPEIGEIPDQLNVEYHFLFDDVDPTHRGMLVVERNAQSELAEGGFSISGIFSHDEPSVVVRLTPLPWPQVVFDFIKHGVWHIWIGIDHILFIIALLLGSVMIVENGRHKPVQSLGQAAWNLFSVITLFTISHSISLSLSTLDILRFSPRLVESVIAASIAVAAFNNIVPLYTKRVGLIVFFFGLFHGFGFANVMAPLGLEMQSLVPSILGFNVGVEIGQLLIICAVFPVLYLLRNWSYYELLVVRLGSAGMIALSLVWFVKRAIFW